MKRTPRRTPRRPAAAFLGIVLPLLAAATRANARDTPSVTVHPTDSPPTIDGRVIEETWKEAALIGPLTQVEPVEGAEPSQKTEVRITFDRDTLYIGIICFDTEPDRIISTTMERDAQLDPDDRIEMIFDTFFDRRNAFWFQINPGGGKGDALIANNGQNFNKPWDGIFEAVARITDRGWETEFAIPFKTLKFEPETTRWGFNITRTIKRHDETARWASPAQNIRLFAVSEAGTLEGLTGMDQGIGLDFKPYVAGTYYRDRSGERVDRDLDFDTGFDLSYNLTPGVKALLTVNTDFAETEVDDVQINLTRFPLFFPEKRDFFLEDSGIFAFADLRRDLIPFFSRRIGIVEEEEVALLAGLKVTGRTDGWGIGILDVQMDSTNGVPSKNLFAARVTRNVLEQSTVGVIATRGDPAQSGQNTLMGADFNYRITDFLDDKILQASGWLLGSETSGNDGDGSAYGFSVGTPNDLIRTNASVRVIGSQFNPALGFVRRPGTRQYEADFSYRPRPGGIVRQLTFGVFPELVTDTGNHAESWDARTRPLGVEFESGDKFEFDVVPQFERLDEPFEIFEDVTLPEGDYNFWRYRVEFEAADKRPVSGRVNLQFGDFYSGQREDYFGALILRPGPFLNVSLEYLQNDVDLDEGDFTTRIGRARIRTDFSPDVSVSNFLQFDNVSDQIGLNSRLRWILQPGNEFFFVLNQGWQRDDGSIYSTVTELSFKVEVTFRF